MDRLGILDAAMRAADLRLPDVSSRRCTVSRYARSACRRCLDVCPTAAITLTPRLRVDPDRCVGCDACAAACPTGALAAPALRDAGRRPWGRAVLARVDNHRDGSGGRSVACRRAAWEPGSSGLAGPVCLGALGAADLVAAGAAGMNHVTLVDGGCAGCALEPAVGRLDGEIRAACDVLAALGSPLEVRRVARPGRGPDRGIAPRDQVGPAVSRRGLFTLVRDRSRRAIGLAVEGALADARPNVDELHAVAPPAARHRGLLADLETLAARRATLRTVHEAPRRVEAVGLPLASVEMGPACDGCGLCVVYCPHGALGAAVPGAERSGPPIFDPASCSGCGLCAEVCPTAAVRVLPALVPVTAATTRPADAIGATARATTATASAPFGAEIDARMRREAAHRLGG